jgi:hypothetical protein
MNRFTIADETPLPCPHNMPIWDHAGPRRLLSLCIAVTISASNASGGILAA